MNTVWDELAAPFPPELVSWRVGPTNKEKTKGVALAYIDARDVMERLDKVLTPANWQRRYSHANDKGGKTICDIGIRVEGNDWVWKADGAGDSDMEGEKGAISDAFKRAAVNFGIGRYLYALENVWVELTQHGNSYVIAEHEFKRLQNTLRTNGAFEQPNTKAASRQEFLELSRLMNLCNTKDELKQFAEATRSRAKELNPDFKKNLKASYDEKFEQLSMREKEPA